MAEIEHVASADGTPIAYRAWGEGEPIVFVHGAGTSGADWLFVMRELRDRFRVVVMDRRGRGSSGDGADYAIEREAEDVLAVLDATGAEMLVGHSYGAMCSIGAAERSNGLRRLVLYEPPIRVTHSFADAIGRLVAAGDHEQAIAAFLRDAAGEAELEAIRSSPAWRTLLDAAPALPRELRAGATWSHPENSIDVPTLFIVGADNENPTYLTGLNELLSRFANLRRDAIYGPDHAAHVFAADRFASLVADFCSGANSV